MSVWPSSISAIVEIRICEFRWHMTFCEVRLSITRCLRVDLSVRSSVNYLGTSVFLFLPQVTPLILNEVVRSTFQRGQATLPCRNLFWRRRGGVSSIAVSHQPPHILPVPIVNGMAMPIMNSCWPLIARRSSITNKAVALQFKPTKSKCLLL